MMTFRPQDSSPLEGKYQILKEQPGHMVSCLVYYIGKYQGLQQSMTIETVTIWTFTNLASDWDCSQ